MNLLDSFLDNYAVENITKIQYSGTLVTKHFFLNKSVFKQNCEVIITSVAVP